jgi:glycosyltransferase involved in cell wall biosynthesis
MEIVIAILAKEKAHTLPLYLQCIYDQTFPKARLHLYVRTNDNTDETPTLLQSFLHTYGHEYKSIFYDDSSVSEQLKQWKQHEWNPSRFAILAQLRQESVDYARAKNAHYFVADCDNFLVPRTLENLFDKRSSGVIGPMLQSKTLYSNFSYEISENGYHVSHNPVYKTLCTRELCGITQVPVIHCTYFLHASLLQNIAYKDGTHRHEYVIFSDNLRKQGISQFLDNREEYGFLTFAETKEEFTKEVKDTWATDLRTKFHPQIFGKFVKIG